LAQQVAPSTQAPPQHLEPAPHSASLLQVVQLLALQTYGAQSPLPQQLAFWMHWPPQHWLPGPQSELFAQAVHW
jgi:hypothetical protein